MRRKAREKLEEDHTEAVHVRRRSENARLLVLGVDVSNRDKIVGIRVGVGGIRRKHAAR